MSNFLTRYTSLVLLLGLLSGHGYCTLSKSDRQKKELTRKKNHLDPLKGDSPSADSPSDDLKWQNIAEHYDDVHYDEAKRFANPSLAYVTPWNRHGYSVARMAAQKFTHISPVWFQIDSSAKDGCVISGIHEIDQQWISDIRQNNSVVKIVPRFIFEKWSKNDLMQLLSSQSRQDSCAQSIVHFAESNSFNGIVLEIWLQAISILKSLDMKRELSTAIINLAEILKGANLEIILVLPPMPLHADEQQALFSTGDFQSLLPFIDYFSIMTYDFPYDRPYAVAPLPWVLECIKIYVDKFGAAAASKILMGLNFYGYSYSKNGKNAMVGHEFISMLKKHKPDLRWEQTTAEHSATFDGHVVFYPTLPSIRARLKLAEALGVGVAIWEIGQGLDYFYQLL